MLYLQKLSPIDGKEIYDMLQEIAVNDNGFQNKVCGMSFEEYECWLQQEYARDNGDLEDWMVPQSSYWLFEGDKPVGYGRIRHYLNDALRADGGNIGYAIRKSERGKGYGNRILALLLKECADLGITEVQISANIDNALSNKVIAFNGGVLIRQGDGKNFYRVDLSTGEMKDN